MQHDITTRPLQALAPASGVGAGSIVDAPDVRAAAGARGGRRGLDPVANAKDTASMRCSMPSARPEEDILPRAHLPWHRF